MIFCVQGENKLVVPVTNLKNEDLRLAEVNRLGIIDRNLSEERKYSSITQLIPQA